MKNLLIHEEMNEKLIRIKRKIRNTHLKNDPYATVTTKAVSFEGQKTLI